MARNVSKYQNYNARPNILGLIPLNQKILWYRGGEIDQWGYEKNSFDEPILLDCKVQYNSQRFYLRAHAGYEQENTCNLFLKGKVDVKLTDKFVYTFPTGDTIEYQPNQISHLFDMTGNVYITKVWVK